MYRGRPILLRSYRSLAISLSFLLTWWLVFFFSCEFWRTCSNRGCFWFFLFFCRLDCENRGAHALTRKKNARAIVPHEYIHIIFACKIFSRWWLPCSRAPCVGSFINYRHYLLRSQIPERLSVVSPSSILHVFVILLSSITVVVVVHRGKHLRRLERTRLRNSVECKLWQYLCYILLPAGTCDWKKLLSKHSDCIRKRKLWFYTRIRYFMLWC